MSMSGANGETSQDGSDKKTVEKHRGWPKGKKRKPYTKDDNAPRRPLNGYVRFMTERREATTSENSNLSFADITKILASQWTSLPQEEKQKYLDDAEIEKAEYAQKLKNYQESKQYKDHVRKIADLVNEENAGPSTSSPVQGKQSVTPPANLEDVPIFTEAFLDHNKAKDAELRQLRKSNAEYTEQNTILQKHIVNLQSAIARLDSETQSQRQSNYRLQMKLHGLKEMIVKVFKDLPLPDSGVLPTIKSAESYMRQIHHILEESPEEYKDFVDSVRNILMGLTKNDLQLLHIKV